MDCQSSTIRLAPPPLAVSAVLWSDLGIGTGTGVPGRNWPDVTESRSAAFMQSGAAESVRERPSVDVSEVLQDIPTTTPHSAHSDLMARKQLQTARKDPCNTQCLCGSLRDVYCLTIYLG